MSKTQPARGMRDFLPADIRKRNYVIGIIKEVYESYGFEPLETPAVENLETLTGKYGEEGNQLMFRILKRGEKLDVSQGEKGLADLALRYDLTVPLARVVANYKNELPKFFKRYQIQPVWRADRPARGRFREFYQCDVDAIGSNSMMVEAELISAVCEILERLGFKDFVIRINHREILRGILESAGVPTGKHTDALTALDKIDKIGREGVEKELNYRGISSEIGSKLLAFLEFFIKDKSNELFDETQKKGLVGFQKEIKAKDDFLNLVNKVLKEGKESLTDKEKSFVKEFRLKETEKLNINNPKYSGENYEENRESDFDEAHFLENVQTVRNSFLLLEIQNFIGMYSDRLIGMQEIGEIIVYLLQTKFPEKLVVDPTLARGLSYYTGTIFEINVPDLAGSLGGGGRYDGLIGMFGKEQIPACGFSLGLERILVVMEERGMFPSELQTNSADVLVTVWNEESVGESLKLANELRSKGLRVLVYPEADKLGKQFKYASQINIPFVCVVGETELAENNVTLKNMQTGEQETVSREEIAEKLIK